MFWQAVENMRTNCKDGKARQARAMIIKKKYFINIPTTPGECLDLDRVNIFQSP